NKPLFELPKKPELTEQKSIGEQDDIIDGKDQQIVYYGSRAGERGFTPKKAENRPFKIEHREPRACKNDEHHNYLSYTVQIPSLPQPLKPPVFCHGNTIALKSHPSPLFFVWEWRCKTNQFFLYG